MPTDPARRLVENVLTKHREYQKGILYAGYGDLASSAAHKLAQMLNFALDRLEEVDDLFGLKEINEMAEEE